MVLAVFVVESMPVHAATLYISKSAMYEQDNHAREKVINECVPEALIPAVMREEILSRTNIQDVVLTDNLPLQKESLAMGISILSLKIPPGAGWSTEKRFIKIKSVLYRDGVIAAEIERYSDVYGGGNVIDKVFKIRGSCHVVEHLARDAIAYTVERFKAMNLLHTYIPATH